MRRQIEPESPQLRRGALMLSTPNSPGTVVRVPYPSSCVHMLLGVGLHVFAFLLCGFCVIYRDILLHSDQTTIQNVFGFIQNYVPQVCTNRMHMCQHVNIRLVLRTHTNKAVAGSREEKKEKVLWAVFEQGDLNGLSHTPRRLLFDYLPPPSLLHPFSF